MDEVTLPAPPEGFKYALVRDTVNTVRDKDPTELTPRQLATLRYREKNREKIKKNVPTTTKKEMEMKTIKIEHTKKKKKKRRRRRRKKMMTMMMMIDA